jgi:hypothetical protein
MFGMKARSTQENGGTTRCMDMACTNGQMEEGTTGSTSRTRDVDLESTIGMMGGSMKAIGTTTNNMAWGSIECPVKRRGTDSGRKGDEKSGSLLRMCKRSRQEK